jgi:hypothetical protein
MLEAIGNFCKGVLNSIKNFFVSIGTNAVIAWNNHKGFVCVFIALVFGAFFSALLYEILFLACYFTLWFWLIFEAINFLRNMTGKPSST